MPAVSASRSAQVRAASAWPARASSSSLVSRPCTNAVFSASITCSRSAWLARSRSPPAAGSCGPVITGTPARTIRVKRSAAAPRRPCASTSRTWPRRHARGRPRPLPSSPPPAIAVTTSNPCGRPSSRGPSRHGPPPSSTSIRSQSRLTSARRVNAPPCQGGAIQDRIGGELRGDQDRLLGLRAAAQPPGQRDRASPTCRGSAGKVPV